MKRMMAIKRLQDDKLVCLHSRLVRIYRTAAVEFQCQDCGAILTEFEASQCMTITTINTADVDMVIPTICI
ncbi:MAG: hypothetical protein U9R53_10925 [Chloroflexota bacterium]|nr:hypothetical protein [Chloroflexota bacterium]